MVKFSVYLNRLVFVMQLKNNVKTNVTNKKKKKTKKTKKKKSKKKKKKKKKKKNQKKKKKTKKKNNLYVKISRKYDNEAHLSRGTSRRRDETQTMTQTNAISLTSDAQTKKNCNRGSALE